MSRLGKLDPATMEKVVYRSLGARRPEVLVGPKFGVDNAIIRVGKGKVMVVTTDPLSLIPALGVKESAWLSVQLLASDITTCGFAPAYAILDFNLPPRMTDEEFSIYWRKLEREFRTFGVAIVGGHTGRFEGCDYTIIGAGTLVAIGPEQRCLSSNMAQVGDSLLMTKGAAISAAAILSRVFPEKVRKEYGSRFLKRAQKLFYSITTARDALLVVSIGVRDEGVSAMHDATEGGVLGGLYEILAASEVGGVIDRESIPLSEEAREVCRLFSIDPYVSLSEGSLIAAVRRDKVEQALQVLRNDGIAAAEVGRVEEKSRGIRVRKKTTEAPLRYAKVDPFWRAYWRAVRRGWK